MKKILMITTGGTIASVEKDDGLQPLLSPDELLKYVPKVRSVCEVEALQAMNIDSTNMSPDNWLTIVAAIKNNYDCYDGFVICHGTDTMAYTACVLSYMIQHSPKPIVITGSQRPINREETDAKANLYDAFVYASSEAAADVTLVFDGKVIAGTRAKKTRTKSYDAFSSIDFPFLATVRDGKVLQYIKTEKVLKPRFYDTLNPKVGLIKLTPGMQSEILNSYFMYNDAVVVSSYGTGGIPVGNYYNFYEIIKKWRAKGKICVMSTQVQSEGSDMSIYKVGTEAKSELGFLEAFDMTQEAALTKLMWILGQTENPTEVRKMFYETVNYDILITEK